MSAISLKIWSYWEGPRTVVQDLCFESMTRVVGAENHRHVTPENLADYAAVPEPVLTSTNVQFRADYVRAALLFEHGGLWMDADVLLLRDPFSECGIQEKTWKERHTGPKKTVSVGIVYSPFPGGDWMRRTLELLNDAEISTKRMQAFDLFNDAYQEMPDAVELGSWKDYYAVTCTQWESFWTRSDALDLPGALGLHLWWGAIKRAKKKPYANIRTRAELLELAPASVLSEYVRRTYDD